MQQEFINHIMTLDEMEDLEKATLPGPWEWRNPYLKRESDIIRWEPYTDGGVGKGMCFDLITRDSGVYGPDVSTCEFIIASRNWVPWAIAELKAKDEKIRKLEKEIWELS